MADKCLTCGKKLSPSTSPREKMYCNSTCRSKRWYHEHLDGGKKVVKKKKLSKKKEVEQLTEHFSLGDIDKSIEQMEKAKLKMKKHTFQGVGITMEQVREAAEKETPPMPVRMKGEDAFDFAARKNEWKKKYA